MGQHELLEALRREGAEQAAAIRRTADSEAGRMRADTARRLDELRTRHEERCKRLQDSRKRTILAEAEREAALVRLQAEHELAGRLRKRATELLKRLRDDDYTDLFRCLAEELPGAAWATLRVNPADLTLAAASFPAVAREADQAISGGLEAATGDGLLTVVNTLDARLDQAWPDLLPHMLAELRK